MEKNLNSFWIKTVSNSSINKVDNNINIKSKTAVYEIPCLHCNKKFASESYRKQILSNII